MRRHHLTADNVKRIECSNKSLSAFNHFTQDELKKYPFQQIELIFTNRGTFKLSFSSFSISNIIMTHADMIKFAPNIIIHKSLIIWAESKKIIECRNLNI